MMFLPRLDGLFVGFPILPPIFCVPSPNRKYRTLLFKLFEFFIVLKRIPHVIITLKPFIKKRGAAAGRIHFCETECKLLMPQRQIFCLYCVKFYNSSCIKLHNIFYVGLYESFMR